MTAPPYQPEAAADISEAIFPLIRRVAERFDASHDFAFGDSCVMLCYVGSMSHGTQIPSDDPASVDDVDLMGVVMPPARYVLGLDTFEHWTAQWDELDVTLYSFHKYARLLLGQNPNVLGTLWLRDEDYLVRGPTWRRFVAWRRWFVSKAAYTSFAGYASSQLHRMTSYSPAIQGEIDQLTAQLESCGWHLQDVMDRRAVPMPTGGVSVEDANRWADRLRQLRAKYHAAYMGEKRRRLVVEHGEKSEVSP